MSLGSTLQIYEFCKNFASILNLRSRYTVEHLHDSFHGDGNLVQQIVIGLIDKFCLHYLINSQTQSNSAFLNIFAQLKNQFVRRSLVQLLWPKIFPLITRIYRIRNYIKDDIDTQFQLFKDLLLTIPFSLWNADQRQSLLLFLINVIGYESDFLSSEMENRMKLKDAFKSESFRELPQKEQELRKLQQSLGNIGKKKAKEQQKILQQCQQCEEEILLLQRAAGIKEGLFIESAVEQLNERIFVFLDEKRAIYIQEQENEWKPLTEDLMNQELEQITIEKVKKLKKLNYFQRNKFAFQPIALENTYQVEEIIEDEMNLDFFTRCDQDTVKAILLALEDNYSQYELNYWKSCWTSAEKRRIWQQRLLQANDQELMEIIGKLPHQLSWVNKKHGQEDNEAKFKSSRLYWFYQNKLYCNAYQQLSKQDGSISNMYLLAITLYEKMQNYIHRKMRTMGAQSQSELDSTEYDQKQQQKQQIQ